MGRRRRLSHRRHHSDFDWRRGGSCFGFNPVAPRRHFSPGDPLSDRSPRPGAAPAYSHCRAYVGRHRQRRQGAANRSERSAQHAKRLTRRTLTMHRLAELDRRYIWHPFTQMQDWLKREPILIVKGHGAVLRDVYGREYLDANSSIWTNLHGHNHPKINAAIRWQLNKIAHSSALGLANEPASLLAEKLIHAANPSDLRIATEKSGALRTARPTT